MSIPLPHSIVGKPPRRLNSLKTDHRKRLRSPKLPSYLSILQSQILRNICTRPRVNFNELMEQTHSSRISVVCSVNSLIDYNYVKKEKVNPKHEKGKLLLLPTIRGISYTCTYLDLSITELVFNDKDEITSYIEMVREAFPMSEHKGMIEPLFSAVLHGDLGTKIENDKNKKELIKYSFQKGMLELFQKNSYNAQNFFNVKVTEWLKQMFSPIERKKIKGEFNKIGNNFTLTLEHFPD